MNQSIVDHPPTTKQSTTHSLATSDQTFRTTKRQIVEKEHIRRDERNEGEREGDKEREMRKRRKEVTRKEGRKEESKDRKKKKKERKEEKSKKGQ